MTMMEMKKENNKTGVRRKHQTKQNVNKEGRGLKGGKVCDVSVDGGGLGFGMNRLERLSSHRREKKGSYVL